MGGRKKIKPAQAPKFVGNSQPSIAEFVPQPQNAFARDTAAMRAEHKQRFAVGTRLHGLKLDQRAQVLKAENSQAAKTIKELRLTLHKLEDVAGRQMYRLSTADCLRKLLSAAEEEELKAQRTQNKRLRETVKNLEAKLEESNQHHFECHVSLAQFCASERGKQATESDTDSCTSVHFNVRSVVHAITKEADEKHVKRPSGELAKRDREIAALKEKHAKLDGELKEERKVRRERSASLRSLRNQQIEALKRRQEHETSRQEVAQAEAQELQETKEELTRQKSHTQQLETTAREDRRARDEHIGSLVRRIEEMWEIAERLCGMLRIVGRYYGQFAACRDGKIKGQTAELAVVLFRGPPTLNTRGFSLSDACFTADRLASSVQVQSGGDSTGDTTLSRLQEAYRRLRHEAMPFMMALHEDMDLIKAQVKQSELAHNHRIRQVLISASTVAQTVVQTKNSDAAVTARAHASALKVMKQSNSDAFTALRQFYRSKLRKLREHDLAQRTELERQYDEDVQRQRRSRDSKVSEIKQSYKRISESQQTDFTSKTRELEQLYKDGIQGEKDAHDTALKESKRTHLAAFTALEQSHASTVQKTSESHEAALEKAEKSHSDALKDLKQSHAADLKKANESHEEIQKETRKKHAGDLGGLEQSHAATVRKLKESHTSAFKQKEDDYAGDLGGLKQSHAVTVRRLREFNTSVIEQIKEYHAGDLESVDYSHAISIRELKESHTSAIKQMKDEHAGDFERMEESHATAVQKLEESHTDAINELVGKHAGDSERMEQSYTAFVRKMGESQTAAINALEGQHAGNFTALRDEHAAALKAERDKHATALEENATALKAEKSKHATALEEHAAALTAEEGKHATALKEIEESHENALKASVESKSAALESLRKSHTEATQEMIKTHQSAVQASNEAATAAKEELAKAHSDVTQLKCDHKKRVKKIIEVAAGVRESAGQANKIEASDMARKHQTALDELKGLQGSAEMLFCAFACLIHQGARIQDLLNQITIQDNEMEQATEAVADLVHQLEAKLALGGTFRFRDE